MCVCVLVGLLSSLIVSLRTVRENAKRSLLTDRIPTPDRKKLKKIHKKKFRLTHRISLIDYIKKIEPCQQSGKNNLSLSQSLSSDLRRYRYATERRRGITIRNESMIHLQ